MGIVMHKMMDAVNCSPDQNFTQIPNEILRNSKLSFKAKGILAILLSNRKGWVSYQSKLSEYGKDGVDSIQTGLAELKQQGYFWPVRFVDKETKRNRGSFWAYTTTPFIFKIEPHIQALEEKGFEIWGGSLKKLTEHYNDWKLNNQEPEKPEVDFPYMAFPKLDNPHLIIPIFNNTNLKEYIKDIGNVPAEQLPPSLESPSLDNSLKKKKPSKEENQILVSKANRVIKHFNKAASKNIRLLPSNRTLIIARLENFTYKDCIEVINKKSKHEWFVECGHMKITTLFRLSKFEGYLNEDPKQYEKKQPGVANGSGISGNIDYSFRPGRDMKIKVDKTNWGKYDNE